MTTGIIRFVAHRGHLPLQLRWRSRNLGVWTFVLLTFGFSGCNGQPSAQTSTPEPARQAGQADDPMGSPPLDLVKFGGWPDAVDQQIASGAADYTVVDYWSLSCPPCLKELPSLARLSQDQAQLGSDATIQTIGVSLDYYGSKSKTPESFEAKIREMLERIDARFVNVICETPSDEVIAGLGIPSIPAVIIYDSNGDLVKKFVDTGETAGFTYEKDILPFLDSLK